MPGDLDSISALMSLALGAVDEKIEDIEEATMTLSRKKAQTDMFLNLFRLFGLSLNGKASRKIMADSSVMSFLDGIAPLLCGI